jgi:hypothetical protein
VLPSFRPAEAARAILTMAPTVMLGRLAAARLRRFGV